MMSQTTKKIRVCCLCETWESGGIEAFLFNVISHMDRTGLEIDIVAAKLGESIFTVPLKESGIQFYQLSGSPRRVRENQKRFRRLLEERKYEVVHLNAYQALSLAYLRQAQKAEVPVRIAHSHNTQLRKSLTKPLKLGLHCWARKHYKDVMAYRWACSKEAAAFLFGPADNWYFIPNGIDIGRFRFNSEVRRKVRGELGLNGKLVVGNVGRLCYQKNQQFLLDIFQVLYRLHPESILLLVGEGEDRPKLEQKAKMMKLEKNVIFYGTTGEVERLLWAMDVFLFPSRFEGFGIVGVEAQAAGLPVICSENIPKEMLVTGKALELSAGAKAWAEAALRIQEHSITANDVVSEAGFDIGVVTNVVKEMWEIRA